MTQEQSEAWTPVHRIVFPMGDQPDGVESLYFVADGAVTPLDRRRIRIAPETRVSFATYFGAVPTAVWRAQTDVGPLRLRLSLDGAARVSVHATDGQGRRRALWSQEVAGDGAWEIALDDYCAGWLWFEIEASSGVVLSDAVWEAPASTREPQTASVAITTHDRVNDCLGVLAALSSDVELAERIPSVFVTDQGRRRIRDDAGFAEVAALLGDRLVVREQDNLGGSGGFSRGMVEAAKTDATHVLLLDDDVVLEPETILRLLAFADHAHGTPLVGAQMLSLTEPTLLYSFGECIDRSRFSWGPVDPELAAFDIAGATIERMPALSRAYDVDFNGWWMCLIPLAVVREIGAALPLFIKWDDAEYGLRAKDAGYRTVTLPGAAIWHMPWTGKDDGLDWQAYFQLRNRLVAALIHGSARRRMGLLLSAFAQDVNHLLCLQYGSVAVRAAALDDVLAGPSTLIATLREGPARPIRILRGAGQLRDAEEGSAGLELPSRPAGPGIPLRLVRVLLHQMRRARSDRGMAVATRAKGKWWSIGLVDAVFLRSATGHGGFSLRRDRRVAWQLLRGAAGRYARLCSGWRRLQQAHRSAAVGLASLDVWPRQWESAAPHDASATDSRES